MGAYLFNGTRFLLGALVLLPFGWRGQRQASKLTRDEALGIALAGLLLFGGITFQQVGLRYTTASNAGFITGLYVVFTPLILMFGRGRGLHRDVWAASLLAGVGLFLLSTGGQLRLAPGDALELVCAGIWAFHVIWIGRLAQRIQALRIAIGQNLLCGGISLAIGLLLEGEVWPRGAISWWAIVYTGVFSIGVGYTLQAVGQRVAPAADAAIILSLEAVFAALFGWLLLDERLSMVQLLGCGLMLAGMILAQARGITQGSRD
jgi:drug/metabolite transporter (DMT)-like permease